MCVTKHNMNQIYTRATKAGATGEEQYEKKESAQAAAAGAESDED